MSNSSGPKQYFYAELAKLTEAGFGIREAAAVMQETNLPAAQARLLESVVGGLASGLSIGGAFAASGNVGALESTIITAGERGGRISSAFQHLADYFALVYAARRHAVRALVYPAILLHVGVFAAIIPSGLMRDDPFPELLKTAATILIVGYVVALGLFFLMRVLLRMAEENALLDNAINRIPAVGAARRNMSLARFTKVYHTCVLAGLSMSEAAETSGRASRSGGLYRAGLALAERAREGDMLGPLFIGSNAFPKPFARSYATAEEAGGLDRDLARWSKLFEENAAESTRTLSVLAPKLIYLCILAFVVWQIIGFYAGYLDAIDSIGED
jgi:type II secretory pathway component PulF